MRLPKTHRLFCLCSTSALLLLNAGCTESPAEETIDTSDDDDDGLNNSEEEDLGTDPNLPDSDGDGYIDGDEVHAGTDPNDAEDTIYQGGWPYNPNKDEIVDPGWDTESEIGSVLPHYTAVDQFGDEVDLYDFAGHGVPMVIDMGTIWCEPCKGMAAYLSDGDTTHVEEYAWWKSDYEGLHELVQSGELFWITVLFSTSESSGPATQEDCEGWDNDYPNEMIPVLADTDLLLYDWIGVESYPVLNMLDDTMTLTVYSSGGPYEVLAELGTMLSEE